MSEEKNYSADSIQALEGMEHVRMRPSMYIGDVGSRGLHHLVYEVVDNSIDEALAGHCTQVDVAILEGNGIRVMDNGRGIPIDIHKKEGVSALQVVMTKIGAGGKFDKDSYKVSGGLHGVGVSVVNALSIDLKASVHKNGKIYVQEYKQGKEQYLVKEGGKTDLKGTEVVFYPDPEIFESLDYHYEILATRMRELSYLNKGLVINMSDERESSKGDDGSSPKERFFSERGLSEFVEFLDSNRERLIQKVISVEGEKSGIPCL
jgi:DNA gyrase subunit B